MNLPERAIQALVDLKRELLSLEEAKQEKPLREEPERRTPERRMRHARSRNFAFQRMCRSSHW